MFQSLSVLPASGSNRTWGLGTSQVWNTPTEVTMKQQLGSEIYPQVAAP